jgi:rod shape-determining protein MreC
MQRIFNIIAVFKEYFVFALLIIFSLVLLSNNDNRQIRSIRAYTIGFIGLMQNAFSAFPNILRLEEENKVLRQLNVNLTDEVSRLREARLENDRLREMLALKDRSAFRLIAAEVVAKNSQLLRNTITINEGDQNGIRLDMAVLSQSGLAGRVIAVSPHYSVAQTILNKDFRAGARIQRSRVDCIVEWTGGEGIVLKNISKKQDVRVGDVVETSGFSSLFPQGIAVGTVSSVTEPPGSLFKEVDAALNTNFSTLEQVFVVLQPADPERLLLEQHAATAH